MKSRAFEVILALVALSVAGFIGFLSGWNSSPGPYLPSEDSFDYHNHHCYPIQKTTVPVAEPSDIWGN